MSKITDTVIIEPASGSLITDDDVLNNICKEAQYFFIQLETKNRSQHYAEIEIYDENGTNIARSVNNTNVSYVRSSDSSTTNNQVSNAFDGSLTTNHVTSSTLEKREWFGVNLGSNKKIAGIRIYGRNDSWYRKGGFYYAKTAPFRIYLYTSSEYTGTFEDGYDNGPLDYDDYYLRSSDATKQETINGDQEVFYFGSSITYGARLDSGVDDTVSTNLVGSTTTFGNTTTYYREPNLPPYNITIKPSVARHHEARYVFLQLETVIVMNYAEIEIYDENGTNIAYNLETNSYIASSIWENASGTSALAAWKVGDGNTLSAHHTASTGTYNEKPWVAIDLGSNKKISSIEIYGRGDNTAYAEGGGNYARTAPFRIFLYKSDEYTGNFSNYGTGPLDYTNYTLHTDDADVNETINDGKQQYFKFDLLQTKIRPRDIDRAISEYSYYIKEARYTFIQLETEDISLNMSEIEIYDENGTNIAFDASQNTVQSSTDNNYTPDKNADGNYANYSKTKAVSEKRSWWGIDFGSNKKIAQIRLYGIPDTNNNYLFGESNYSSHAPHRIHLYTDSEYSDFLGDSGNKFKNTVGDTNSGTGPIGYDKHYFQSDNAMRKQVNIYDGTSSKKREVFSYGHIGGFKQAQYMFIQLETANTYMNYSEIEIYDENGNNIARSVNNTDVSYVQSSNYTNNAYPASKAFDGSTTDYHHTNLSANTREWLGVNLGSNKKIAGIRVYGRNGTDYIEGGTDYALIAPFRIFLYTYDEYTDGNGIFANGGDSPAGTGPLNYNDYHLHTNDATKTEKNSTQQVFYFGVNALIGDPTTNIHSKSDIQLETYNKAIADVEYVNYSGHGNYYHMDVSMHYSDISYGVYLPTVTFTKSNDDERFTNTMRIAQLAEQGFTGFYEADFADGITVIDEDAFLHDKKVCVVTINQVTDICGNAFKGCSNLRAVTLDTAVDSNYNYKLETIGTSAFENCTALKQIFIPDSVTSIPNNAFKGCTNLEVAVMGYGIPRSVNGSSVEGSIGESAFEDCTSLTYFYIPETVTSVGDYAFKNCSSLESLYIDDSVNSNSIGTGAFTTISSGCIVYVVNDTSNYPDTLFPTNATIQRFTVVTVNLSSGTLTYGDVNTACSNASISETDYWKAKCTGSFTMFGTNVFRYTSTSYMEYGNLVSISIQGSSVTKIDDHCFISLPVFQGLYIPSIITSIYGNANYEDSKVVYDCDECRQISFEQNSPNLFFEGRFTDYQFTFATNHKLRAMIFPHQLEYIISYMCDNNLELQLVNIFQKNAKTDLNYFYGYNHFRDAINLEEIHLFVNNTTSNGSNLFGGCTNLKRIYIYNNHDATRSQINDGGSQINDGDAAAPGANVFYVIKDSTANDITNHSQWNLHTIFKTSVTTIPDSKYDGDTNLKTITFEHGASSPLTINKKAFKNTGITDGANHIKWNDRLFTFVEGSNADDTDFFGNYDSMTSIFIPDQFTVVPKEFALRCDSLSNIYWGNNPSVKRINNRAFLGTSSLRKIHIPASVIAIGSSAFTFCQYLNKVTFGAGSRLKYIDDAAFGEVLDNNTDGNIRLSSIALPNSIKTIKKKLFYNSITKHTIDTIIIPSSLEYLDENFIVNHGNDPPVKINNIYIPNSITNTGGPRRHHGYKDRGFDVTVLTFRTGPTPTTYYIPSHLSSNFVSITNNESNDTFHYYDFVTFSGTNNVVTDIYYDKHYYHAEFNESVTTIGDGDYKVAQNTNRLISVNFHHLVTSIKANAFQGYTKLAYVTFHSHSNITEIGASAFRDCTNIHDIELPYKLKTIGAYAFYGCNNLRSINIPYNVESIGTGAFINCYKLEQVSMGDTLYNDISNNLNEYFKTPNIKVIPTLEFTSNELTLSVYEDALNTNNLKSGNLYYPKITSSVKHIYPEIYAKYPEISLYENYNMVYGTTSGVISYKINGISYPVKPGVYLMDGILGSGNSYLPLYTSVPDIDVPFNTGTAIKDTNDHVTIDPGYTAILYENHYDELNLDITHSNTTSSYQFKYNDSSKYIVCDNSGNKVPYMLKHINTSTTSGFWNMMDSMKIFCNYKPVEIKYI